MTTYSERPFPEESSPQDRRVWALERAKRIMVKNPFSTSDVSSDVSLVGLIDLSMFILTGEDPYKTVREEAPETS